MRRIVMIMLLLLFALVLGAGTENETSGKDPVLDEKIKAIIHSSAGEEVSKKIE